MAVSWMTALWLALALLHVFAAAAWFGAMLYSLMLLQPRAMRFFARPEDFEHFIATISDGARWKVLAVAALSALSGVGLVVIRGPGPGSASGTWLTLVGLKVALLLVALSIFSYASWRLWPARVLATPDEIPWFQRQFRRVGWSLLTLVGLNIALGVAVRVL